MNVNTKSLGFKVIKNSLTLLNTYFDNDIVQSVVLPDLKTAINYNRILPDYTSAAISLLFYIFFLYKNCNTKGWSLNKYFIFNQVWDFFNLVGI